MLKPFHVERSRYASFENTFRVRAQLLISAHLRGEMDTAATTQKMSTLLKEFHRSMYLAGRRSVGNSIPNLSQQDLRMLHGAHSADMKYFHNFMRVVREGGGKMPYNQRMDLYALGGYSVYLRGAVLGTVSRTPETIKWHWMLNKDKENCFPGGTMISTPNGDRPIAFLRVGDFVSTRSGPRRISRVFRSKFTKPFTRINSGAREVFVTPGHPFLSPNGWLEARGMSCQETLVVLKDGDNPFVVDVTIPDSNHREPTLGEIQSASNVSSLLGNLPVCEWMESRMPVPVSTVSFDNESADADVYHEMCFDDETRFIRDADSVKNGSQFHLQLGWANLLQLGLSLSERTLCSFHNFWVSLSKSTMFCFRPLLVHGVIGGHIDATFSIHKSIPRLFSQSQPQNSSLSPHLFDRKTKTVRNCLCSIIGVATTQNSDSIFCPDCWFATNWLRTLRAQISGSLAFVPTGWACSNNFSNLCVGVGEISTKNRAISLELSDRNERVSTPTTFSLRLCNVTHDVDYPKSDGWVYNIEVDGVHEYIAEGFVVHNCNDCLDRYELSMKKGGLVYAELSKIGFPGERTACGHRCFPAGTVVQSETPVSGFRRWFTGDLVSIQTARGYKLTGTPNHPILTTQGWVPMDGLVNGMNVLSQVGGDGESGRSQPYKKDRPSFIEEVFGSLYNFGIRERVMGIEVDFHGERVDGDVDVVVPLSFLMNTLEPEFCQLTNDLQLFAPHKSECSFSSCGTSNSLIKSVDSSSRGFVSVRSEGFSLFNGRSVEPDSGSFTDTSWFDTGFQEAISYGRPVDAEIFRDRVFRFAGNVSADHIVSVDSHSFSGHVYNLSTTSGAYVANHIITHNCWCGLVSEFGALRRTRPTSFKHAQHLTKKMTVRLGEYDVELDDLLLL